VIIEIDLLNDVEIAQATTWCADTGMAMVKTSTGMLDGGQGATLHVVALIADTLRRLNARVGIKASGGIKTRAQALAFANAGVSRLGTSSGVAIVQGAEPEDNSGY
jgi:deoxyribose-phosphate aldolase